MILQEKPSQNVDSDETQDLFSNNDSPSGGATSQTSAKGYHGKSNENEASQGSNRYFCGVKTFLTSAVEHDLI